MEKYNCCRSIFEWQRNSIPYAVDQIKIMLDLLQYNEIPINEFIDLGAGDGVLSHIILDHFADSKACLVDFSEPMIDAAKIRLRAGRRQNEVMVDQKLPRMARTL